MFSFSNLSKFLLLFSLFFLRGNLLQAKPGNSAEHSDLYRITSINITNNADVAIWSEQVNARVEGDYVYFKVMYEFSNNNERSVEVEAAVSFLLETKDDEGAVWNADYVKNFKAWSDDGSQVSLKEKFDAGDGSDSPALSQPTTAAKTKRKSYQLSFNMVQISSKGITVEYTVKSHFKDVKDSKNFFTKYSPRALSYDFSPALHWGKGIIRDFSFIIDCGNIPRDFIRLSGTGFGDIRWQDGLYMMSRTDMPVTKNSVLQLEYDYNVAVFNEFITTFRAPSERVLKTKISSQADVYSSPDNLYDFDFGSVWAEGTSHQGVGEYIEVVFDDYPLCGIAILNGSLKSEDDFTENGRLAKVKIEREYINSNNCLQTETLIREVPYVPYKRVTPLNFSKSVVILADFGDTKVPTRKLRLTILEAHPGTRFNKTCVSELFWLGNE